MSEDQNDKLDAEKVKRRAALKAALDQTDWQALTDCHNHNARVLKSKYDALVRRGFNESQALFLCRVNWEV